MRSFVAIELPDELKLKLDKLMAQLESERQPWVKWVRASGIHLTLKFLGDIITGQTGEITRAIEEATQGFSPFQLDVKALGVFPNWQRAQVAWVGIGGELIKLSQLQQRLDSNLANCGFAPESRPFSPHLTIARIRNHATLSEWQKFGKLIADTKFEAGSFKVNAVSLMRSQLTKERAIYRPISSIRL
ncbi:RNA 2',3'-cyclic phosphodiesterase [Chloroflexota bacterium]